MDELIVVKRPIKRTLFSLLIMGLGACTHTSMQPGDPINPLNQNGNYSLSGAIIPAVARPGDTSPHYLVTTSANLWEKLGADFGLKSYPPSPLEQELESTSKDLWARMRAGFALPYRNHPKVRKEAEEYADYRDYLDTVFERAEPYLYYVVQEIEKRGMPTEIALVPVIESAYQPSANSSGGAAGIWQFIPSTGRNYGLKQNFWYDGRRDVIASTNAALNYLEKLNADFDGDWALTLAAYNSGEGTVLRAVKKNRQTKKPINFWALDLPGETKAYVPRLLAIAAIVANPEDYNITLRYIPDSPYIASVDLDSQIDLKVAAKMADISHQEIQRLNPGFTNGATDPKGAHPLILPIEKVPLFTAKLATLEDNEMMPGTGKRQAQKKPAKQEQATKQDKHTVQAATPKPAKAADQTVALVQPTNITANSLQDASVNLADTTSKLAPITYTVREGDSLARIARRFKTTVAQLQEWNTDLTGKYLKPGHNLKLYLDNSAQASE